MGEVKQDFFDKNPEVGEDLYEWVVFSLAQFPQALEEISDKLQVAEDGLKHELVYFIFLEDSPFFLEGVLQLVNFAQQWRSQCFYHSLYLLFHLLVVLVALY